MTTIDPLVGYSDSSLPAASSGSLTQQPSQIRPEFRMLINELREQNFDTIRFATYRAACKLRFIQRKVNLHLVDIWNIIESFRENGLNTTEYNTEVKLSRIEILLSTVYHNLNKRLPAAQQIDTDKAIGMLLSFILAAYDRENVGKLRVFSVKIALATLCAGKLLDKLRYIFSQISDNAGVLDHHRFTDYLREVLALPTAVFEGPTFGFSDAAARSCFEDGSRVTVNLFLDCIMSEPCPACLMWLPLLHRMASVEHVFHPVVCDACGRESFTGFRYKCQRCHNYQLCQDCFWRGRVSGAHTNQHEMKEYSSYKSPAKQLGHSISKSLRCMPTSQRPLPHPGFPDQPERTLDLSNVVPYTPPMMRNGNMAKNYDSTSLGSRGSDVSPMRFLEDNGVTALDDEHRLIARYSAKLASRVTRNRFNFGAYPEDQLGQRAVIQRLEQRNKEIVREIQRLQAMHTAASLGNLPEDTHDTMMSNAPGAMLENELHVLRSRKDELEQKMAYLQDSRRDLMGQLEQLMGVLKTSHATPREMSPRSPSSLSGLGGDVRTAFRESTPPLSSSLARPANALVRGLPKYSALQTDLLSAADSIANTMSSLVKELEPEEEIAGQMFDQNHRVVANHESSQMVDGVIANPATEQAAAPRNTAKPNIGAANIATGKSRTRQGDTMS